MSCSRKEYLDRVKKLGIRLNDHKTVSRAVCLEIEEREKEIADLSNYITSCSGRLQQEIDSITPSGSVTSGDVQALITTASGDLQQQIAAETATRLNEIGNINSTINTLLTHSGLNETQVNTLISGAFGILQDQINYLSDQISGSGA
jgi:hypothetical protein